MAVADDNLYDNGSIEAPAEHPMDEYETLALGEWVTSRRDDVEDYEEPDHTTWGRSSIRGRCILEAWIW